MEEVIQPTVPVTPVVPTTSMEPKSCCCSKSKKPSIFLLVILGLAIIAGAVYLGMKIQERGLQGSLFPPEAGVNYNSPTTVPTAIAEPTQTTDESANWKTYANENISIKYPSDWTVGEKEVLDGSNNQTIKSSDGIYSLLIEARINYDQSIGKPFLNPLTIFTDPNREKQKITLDNEPAIKVLSYTIFPGQPNESTLISVYLMSKNEEMIYILEFSTKSLDMAKVRIGSSIFDQILSTFKFIQ